MAAFWVCTSIAIRTHACEKHEAFAQFVPWKLQGEQLPSMPNAYAKQEGLQEGQL